MHRRHAASSHPGRVRRLAGSLATPSACFVRPERGHASGIRVERGAYRVLSDPDRPPHERLVSPGLWRHAGLDRPPDFRIRLSLCAALSPDDLETPRAVWGARMSPRALREGPLLAAARTANASNDTSLDQTSTDPGRQQPTWTRAVRTRPPGCPSPRLREPLEVPELLALQTDSFDWLIGNDGLAGPRSRREAAGEDVSDKSGLQEIFEEISPIEDFSETMSLSFENPVSTTRSTPSRSARRRTSPTPPRSTSPPSSPTTRPVRSRARPSSWATSR